MFYVTIIANDSLFCAGMSVRVCEYVYCSGAFRADIDVSAMRLRQPRRYGHPAGCAKRHGSGTS